MRFLFVLVLVYTQSSAISQINQTIVVPLTTVGGSEPFYPSQSPTRLSDSSLKFKGIPNGLKQYKIKERSLLQTTEKLYVLYGLNELGKRLILFDTNFDGDFSNEAPYLFDQDLHYDKSKAKAIEDTTRSVEIRLPNAPSIFIKPIIYNCCMTYQNPVDSIWHLFVMTNYHREGKFSAGN